MVTALFIVFLVAGVAFFVFVVSTLHKRIDDLEEEAAEQPLIPPPVTDSADSLHVRTLPEDPMANWDGHNPIV